MMRVICFCVLLCGLLTACDTGSAPATPTAVAVTPTPAPSQPTDTPAVATDTPAPAATPIVVTLQGSGELTTTPFLLASGDYLLTWTTTTPAGISPPCWISANLIAVGGDTFPKGTFTDPNGAGTTAVYGLTAGKHYLKVFTACNWMIAIQPQH